MAQRCDTMIAFGTIIFLCFMLVTGQQVSPFVGQGTPPPNGTTVYVTVALDRLIDVNDRNYRFEAILFFLLTWKDPRAAPNIMNSTAMQQNGNATCSYPCTNLYSPGGINPCCDGVWLPHLEFVNARGFSQDRLVRYGVKVGPDGSDSVAWWSSVQGEFYTNLYFGSFPFDSQKLVVQIAYADATPEIPVEFAASNDALSLFLPKHGDAISGWNVNDITMTFYNITKQEIYSRFINPSNPNDPFPVHSYNGSYEFSSILWNQGFAVFIDISRISLYFVLTAIIPIALNVWLALLVFSVSPKHLDTRLGVVVTLFLALTALMFVVGAELPQSSNVVPTQQLVLVSYFILGFVGLESIGVYKIVTIEKQKQITARIMTARETLVKRLHALQTSRFMKNIDKRKKVRVGSYLRRRRRNNNDDSNNPGEVTVPIATTPPRSPHRSDGVGAALADTLTEDSFSEQDFRSQSDGNSYASSEDNRQRSIEVNGAGNNASSAQLQQQRNWLSNQMTKMSEGWKEMRQNPDYALYIALRVDSIVFWCTLIVYNVAMIVILVVGATLSVPTAF